MRMGDDLAMISDLEDATASGLATGDDGRMRPAWALGDPLLLEYYDTEWGMPIFDERGLFERLALESFQSGLSWLTVLRKREAFREAFSGFEPDAVAAFDDDDLERLLADSRIIRNRAKIAATMANARATVALRGSEHGDLAQVVWSFRPDESPPPRAMSDIPSETPESRALAKALKARGFRFVGPTTMYALMQAIGMVDDHLVGSHRRGSSGLWSDDGRWIGGECAPGGGAHGQIST